MSNIFIDDDNDIYVADREHIDLAKSCLLINSNRICTEGPDEDLILLQDTRYRQAIPGTRIVIEINERGEAETKVEFPEEVTPGNIYADKDDKIYFCTVEGLVTQVNGKPTLLDGNPLLKKVDISAWRENNNESN